ncbi:hypothetical protein ACIBI7_18030 [Nonomuraea fuscirosea]|uniref:hypothetical protein n=1 Tax=Nonomuraea fuscirosea TaxID=1291556 RepID=UPI00379F95EA
MKWRRRVTGRLERGAVGLGGGVVDELGLAALPVRRHDHGTGGLGRDGGAVVGADHVQAQVEARRDAR